MARELLEEQVLAAYPNEQIHEPVLHFAVEQSEDGQTKGTFVGHQGADPSRFRRSASAEADLHLDELRQHCAKRANLDAMPTDNQAIVSHVASNADSQKLNGKLTSQSPPMLGNDLIFPLSRSPKMTRCDVDHAPVPQKHVQEENLSEDDHCELWRTPIKIENNPDSGLWMGYCKRGDSPEQDEYATKNSGLKTPAVPLNQGPDVFAGAGSNFFVESVNAMLANKSDVETQIQNEFHDGFVTQIYNYLSLGYPSLAHQFDDELSKITSVSVEELRRDDERADAKGYVGAPEGEGTKEEAMREGKCVRWTTLKSYIHEWARQQPAMADSTDVEWGIRARRGSWAI